MEYCCHVWADTPSCYMEFLDKLRKQICRTLGPSLAVSLEPLARQQNVANLSLFCKYYSVLPPFLQGALKIFNVGKRGVACAS